MAAGGVGVATLAVALLTSPDQVFLFFTEAFIPIKRRGQCVTER
jgi:hypothetical protein